VLAGPLMAFDANTGSKLWQAAVRGGNCSPVLWTSGGTKYVICRTSQGLVCAKLASGEIAWKVPASGHSTPVISGDVAVFLNIEKTNGLAAYRLSPEKAELIWSAPTSDRGSTPVIYNGNVYLTGGRAACYGLDKGDLKWEEPFKGEIASPFIADGKLFGSVAYGGQFLMIRASGDKYELLGEAKLGANWIPSPCITDGKLYIRSNKGVACYDLRKDAAGATAQSGPEAAKR
jgi:outer membrane protein assembly factor BamB